MLFPLKLLSLRWYQAAKPRLILFAFPGESTGLHVDV